MADCCSLHAPLRGPDAGWVLRFRWPDGREWPLATAAADGEALVVAMTPQRPPGLVAIDPRFRFNTACQHFLDALDELIAVRPPPVAAEWAFGEGRLRFERIAASLSPSASVAAEARALYARIIGAVGGDPDPVLAFYPATRRAHAERDRDPRDATQAPAQ